MQYACQRTNQPIEISIYVIEGISCDVIVSNVDKQTISREFEHHSLLHSFGFVPHLNKNITKFLFTSLSKNTLTVIIRHEFKSWMSLIAFHIALILSGKV